MWIRSQNKKILSKVNEVLICTMDDNKYFIEGFWNRGSDTLGIYSSEEKAFAVLDEIQRAVESANVYSTNRVSNVYSMSNEYVAVYQMPVDEDVEV